MGRRGNRQRILKSITVSINDVTINIPLNEMELIYNKKTVKETLKFASIEYSRLRRLREPNILESREHQMDKLYTNGRIQTERTGPETMNLVNAFLKEKGNLNNNIGSVIDSIHQSKLNEHKQVTKKFVQPLIAVGQEAGDNNNLIPNTSIVFDEDLLSDWDRLFGHRGTNGDVSNQTFSTNNGCTPLIFDYNRNSDYA